MAWRKIKSAPRRPLNNFGYGPKIVLWNGDGKPHVGCWDRDFKRWYFDTLDGFHDPQPTHWMKFPKPPKDAR